MSATGPINSLGSIFCIHGVVVLIYGSFLYFLLISITTNRDAPILSFWPIFSSVHILRLSFDCVL